MDDIVRLWVTAILLGLWVGGSRMLSQLDRYPLGINKVGALMGSLSATILALLYAWEPMRDRPSMLLFVGGFAAWFGPELPTIMRQLRDLFARAILPSIISWLTTPRRDEKDKWRDGKDEP